MLQFGPWSTTLGLAAAFGALVALLLWCARGNRSAQRLLATLLIVAVLRLMPYVLGFAGAYDAWPWLSFAPFDLRLAIGPLLYLYLLRLATPGLPQQIQVQ
ncbi:MAG: AraC family transcriptional regulator, partial [Oxalobacteraceae bacterium]